jgi:hypothetical protein
MSDYIYQGPHQFSQFPGLFLLAGMVTIIIVHVCFATAVVRDLRRGRQNGRESWLVGTWVWALATLAGGVFVAGVYWLMHHSRLNKENHSTL